MAKTLRIGMIGLDTSHAGAFTKILNDESNPHHVAGGTIVKAFPGGSEAMAKSRDRVGEFTDEMRDVYKVPLVDSVAAAAEDVDAVMLTSVDGRQHLEQFQAIAGKKIPVFIDKPVATKGADAAEIFRVAESNGSPVMSCSSIRYAKGISELPAEALGCTTAGPVAILEDFPAYYWYGIHTAEVLFSKMGTGCVEVSVTKNEKADVIVGKWSDGRTGSIYGYRFDGANAFEATVYTSAGPVYGVASTDPPYYAVMLPHILEFFRTGNSPLNAGETVEIALFLEAANSSAETGRPIRLTEL